MNDTDEGPLFGVALLDSRQSVNENAVLYALSTLAQTCAALAAFVGAVGLFRLQALREGRRSAEQTLRSLLVDISFGASQAYALPLTEILAAAKWVGENAEKVGRDRAAKVIEAHTAWNGFGPGVHRSSVALSVFETWNLLVILASLGGFAHVPALVCQSWTTWAVWLIALVTVVVSGVAVFVWLERG